MNLFECPTHSFSTERHGGSLNAYLAYTTTCDAKPMDDSVFELSRQFWFQLTGTRVKEGLTAL